MLHILLGRPWFYDRDVYHCGKENTFHFLHNAMSITLYPQSIEEIKKFKGSKPQTEAVKSKANVEEPKQQAASRKKTSPTTD